MSRTTKRFLSILLTAVMVLSLGITGWAIDDITIVDPTKPTREVDEHVTTGFEGGTDLELREIDPSELNVPRLGAIEDEGDELNAEELPFGLNDIVRVSIVLNDPATMAAGYSTQNIAHNGGAIAYREALKQQQADVEAAIAAAGVTMNVKWNLTLVVNIISAEVRYTDIDTIKAVPGVREVWLETKYEPQVAEINTVNTTEHMVGAVEVWNSGYTGAGTLVAIVDTGTNQDHLSFDPEALEYALAQDGLEPDLLTWEKISALAGELNAPVNSNVYKNTKIPYAYNYIDGGYITDHDSDSMGEHGSHVSGIAAANRYVKVDGEFVDAAEAVWAVGVAPDAQILTMKVFGQGGGAYDSDYMSAIEDAIVLGADSVNLSLGSGSPGFTFSNGYQDVMDSLIECGTNVVISMGNSYSWADFLPSGVPYLYAEDVGLHTGGSPGSFINSFTVAAAQNTGAISTPLYFNGDQAVVYTETSEDYSNEPMSTIAGTYDYVLLNGPGVVTDDDGNIIEDHFANLGSEILEGKVALCYRGGSSFFQKANAAVEQGAVAVVIINNQDGIIRMNLTGYEHAAPAVSILKADGDAVLAASEEKTDENGNTYYVGTVEVTDVVTPLVTTAREDATITEFSSWGVPGSLILKPEITAPGGDIYSVNGMTDDGYEFMSGTSMAAPHVTGMAALLGQYVRENNLEEITGQNSRTLINSLLMSTATPMIVDGSYISILQQGAGLGDTFAATQAKSYILMGEDATASWADGKVKVELGQDAAREGVYTYSFSVNNFSDVEMTYELATDLFTQWIAGSDGQNLFLDTGTIDLGGMYSEAYDFVHFTPNLHDVDKDGDTDKDDVQALLDYITGLVEGDQLDLEAGEMDGTDGISSYDAQLLLEWLEEQGGDNLIVPAHESVTVTVTLALDDQLISILDGYFPNGWYIEGFTYVNSITETEDGEYLGAMHSIPILGFFGSFTEASMFDCVSPIDAAYGSTKISYTGNPSTNYLTINNGNGSTIFMGNPYAIEDEFPADRLAISPVTKLVSIKYNLIRNAATTGWLALDEDFNVLKSGNFSGQAYGAWYYVNGQSWQDTASRVNNFNTTVNKLGVNEGDVFTLGFFAIPEYYGMMLHPGENINTVTPDEIGQLLADGELGAGSYIGYTFTVDGETPTAEAKLSDDGTKITVTAKDNNYIAYIGIMDVSGNTVFAGEIPEQTEAGEEVEITFDVSDLELPNGVAIFVGDYAANEKAYLIIFDPTQPITATKTVWMLTDKLSTSTDFIIASGNTAGTAYALNSQGTNAYTGSVAVEIVTDDLGTYIDAADVQDSFVWTTRDEGDDTSGYYFDNKNDGGALGFNQVGGPMVCWENPDYANNYVYRDSHLLYQPYASYGYGISFSSPNFIFTSGAGPLYIYTPVTVEIELDPSTVSSVTVTPDNATLILGVIPTVELRATVEPIVVPDLTVTWTSSDETVATVDEAGLVTAVGEGTAIITATSNHSPDKFGTATITVVEKEPMDIVIYGQVAFASDDIEYAAIDLSNMGVTDLSDNAMFSAFYGGGRSGDYIYGNDIDNDFHRYNAEDAFAYDEDYHFQINPTWALIDIGCFPSFTIADYTNVTDDNPDPATYDYNYILTGFNSSNNLCYFNEEGSLSRFDLTQLNSFVAVAFAGANIDPDEQTFEYYYLLLAEDGTIYIWTVYPDLESGGMSAEYGEFAHVGVLNFGEDKTAYSMSYYEDDDVWGVFIADNSNSGIYWVNFDERDAENNVNAHFVGKIDNSINLSSLSNDYYDTVGPLGTVNFGLTEGGDNIDVPVAPAAFREAIRTGEVLHAVTDRYAEPAEAGYEIVEVETDPEDVEIVEILGSLDAASNAIRKPVAELDSAELLNPSYEDDGYVAIGITTPGYEAGKLDVDALVPSTENGILRSGLFPMADGDKVAEYYNGFATVVYDPEALTPVDYEIHPDLQVTSIAVDEENGIIRFAYASLTPVEEGLVAIVYFVGPEKSTEVTVTTIEANDDLDVGDTTVIPLPLGYTITIEDYTNGGATTSIDTTIGYAAGEFTFTVEADQAVAVIRKDGPFPPRAVDWDEEYYRYTTVDCVTDEDGNHTFTIMIEDDTTICLVYKGDVNLNGKVETKDGTMVKRYAVDDYDLSDPLERLVADVDGSGTVEGKDGTMIARQVVGTYEIAW